jgi:hypothetical protein
MDDPVQMYHPDLKETVDEPVEVPRESYEAVWKPKGWRIWPPKTTKKEK